MDLLVDRHIINTAHDFQTGPANATLTFQISLQKFCRVVSQFDQQKRERAKETGFGVLLEMKISHKTKLKFSAFLMERLDPETSKVVLDMDREIELTDGDVQNVFAYWACRHVRGLH